MSLGKNRQYPGALKFNFDVAMSLSHAYQELIFAAFKGEWLIKISLYDTIFVQ